MENHVTAMYKPTDKVKEDNPSLVTKRSVKFSKKDGDHSVITINGLKEPADHPDYPAISDLNLHIASTYVRDAKIGHNFKFKHDERSLRMYDIYNKWYLEYLLYFFLFVIMALALFEDPAVPNLALPIWSTMIIESTCLAYFTFRLIHSKTCMSGIFWMGDIKNWIVSGVIVITVLDMIIYAILLSKEKPWMRLVRVLRPLFLLNFKETRELRRSFRNIRRSLPGIFSVLILLFLVIGLFALLAREIFEDDSLLKPDASDYMSQYFENFWDLYVLVTTANSPDIMMPAYDSSPWTMLFFIIYVILCIYIFMSIFLAVIYKDYRKHLKNEVQKSVFMKRRHLVRAWDTLKVWKNPIFVIPWQRWMAVMKQVEPSRSVAELKLIWKVLDKDEDNNIDKRAFMKTVDILNVTIIEKSRFVPLWEKYFPSMYNSKASQFVINLIKHRFFGFFFDLLIVANAILIGFRIEYLEWFFLTIFSVEIVLKLYALGLYCYFTNLWNVFDFVVIVSAVILSIAAKAAGSNGGIERRSLDIVLVLRVLRLVRIFNNFEKFQVIMKTLVNIGPSIVPFGGVIVVIYYVYAIIGMEIFAGKITYYGYPSEEEMATFNKSLLFCGNPKLEGSEFYRDHYCNNNFNNILKAFITLFELMIVNQWHVVTSGFVAVTSKAARIYFLCFHITMVIIIVNIFIAFILEVFMVEYSLSKSSFESEIEKKIEELGLRAQVGSTTFTDRSSLTPNMEQEGSNELSREEVDLSKFQLGKSSNSVLKILQNMFEGELDEEDLGPADVEDLEQLDVHQTDTSPYPLTLGNVV
ncbi:Two pore calcium channel protein 1 [Holothuria leucospilota]|uniref:Two pore calcium channel protein 1 n=1 Tax=Holothuria leucospilota TaxID=206669 RepID=A0A9Q1HHJ9_HOLLE|nr:Two pore calcium channel protein 1 [Holothuria leucospilota]